MAHPENETVGQSAEDRAIPTITGRLHIFVAFDWGEEVDLDAARRLIPAEVHALPRRTRTPPSIAYQFPPLRFELPPVPMTLTEIGTISADADLVVFDFGAAGLGLQIPFELGPERLTALAGSLADSEDCRRAARGALEPVFNRLLPAIRNPCWVELSEEYFAFQLFPDSILDTPERMLKEHAGWLAGLVRLEPEPLSVGEIAEALRLSLSYSPHDLVVADWAAAVILDRDCEEILEVMAFANLQLLEFRHIDGRLDSRLKDAYGLMSQLARRRLPLWRTHARQLRDLGELNVEVNEMLERAGNALMLVGDPYLARVYHLLAARFHLDDWGRNIRQAIEVLQGIYQVVSDQAATSRGEALEAIVVVLILIEVGLAIWRH
ncbi:MAG TPA: hypothetical protein VL475_04170 [Planctomycetaceae bacterium]|jgi:hypothetical protein|nr:hypothetical protein [Planctomycetaceae bacterium]